MFGHCGLLSSLNLSGWDTSEVTDMHAMFSECRELTTIGDIEKWETANVTNMSYMFNCCLKLETQSISNWNTSNVTDMNDMFSNCYKMKRIDVSGWDTSKVTDMVAMFNNTNCTIINIANFDMSDVTGPLTTMFRTTNVTNPPLVRLNLPSHDINVELGENFLMNQTNLKYVKCESKNNIVKVVSHLPSRPADNPGKIFTKIPLSEFTDITIETLANKNWAIVSVNEGLKVLAKYRFAKNIWGSVLPKINSQDDIRIGFVDYFIEDEMLDTVDEVIRFNVSEESQQTVPASEIVTRTIYVMEGDIASTSNRFAFGPHGEKPTDYMKKHASAMLSIDELDLSQFSQLTGLVRNCSNLKSLNITQYPTVPLSTLESAFASAKSLPTLDVSNFDVSLVQSLQWTFYDMMYVTQITGLENWNTPNLKYMRNMFDRCYQLTSLNLSSFNTANVENMYCLFANCQRLTEIVGVENFITTNVKNMEGMFANCQSLPSLDVSGFDTRNVEQMSYMFQYCLLLPVIDVSGFDTSKVMQIDRMFDNCKKVKVLDVSNWDVSNVTNMKQTFHHCYGLTSLDVSNWNTSNTTIMDGTFRYCIALKSIDVSKWDTSKVKYMESIFGDCRALTTLDLSDWDTSIVIDADWMVGAMDEIRTINLNNIVLNDNCTIENFFTRDSKLERVYMNNIDTLNKLVSKLPDRSETTTGKIIMPNKDQVPAETVALLNGKNWHLTTLITSYKFDSNIYEDLIPVFTNGFDEDKYVVVDTNNSKGVITRNIESAEGKLPDYIRFGRLNSTQPENGCLLEICDMNTDNLVTAEHMFDWCANLTKVNTKHFNTSKVTSTVSMFYQCESLTSLDVSGFDTSKVGNMSHMFGKCKSLTSIDVSKWNTSEVGIMEHLFAQCESLTSIDVSNFDTRNVWNMYDMFCDCHSLTTLDVSNFDTRKVTVMSGVFARGYNLTDLDVSNWTADKVIIYSNLLSNTSGLLTKITLNNLEIANMIITYLPDRTGKEAGTLAYYDIDPTLLDTTTLQAKNWNLSYEPIMAKYIFNSNEFENLLPRTPNYTQSNYEIIDDVKADGRVVRTLKYRNNLRPTHIRFGESRAESDIVKMSSLKNVIYLDIKDNITSMDNLLANARSLIRVNTRNWDTSNVTDMYCAFFHCYELKEIDVCDWDVRKVEKMQYLFHKCYSITQLDLQNWHTNSVKEMHNMFCDCNNLVDLDLSSFNTSKVINMSGLFINCRNLKSLNLNGFDMNKLENLDFSLFGGCASLNMIEVNNCDTDTINKIVSKLPSRDGEVFGKLYAIRGVDHAGLQRPSDIVNWKVVIRGGNIKAVHIPEELLNTIGLGNNVLLRHIHIGERFL
jgi:surface protein